MSHQDFGKRCGNGIEKWELGECIFLKGKFSKVSRKVEVQIESLEQFYKCLSRLKKNQGFNLLRFF